MYDAKTYQAVTLHYTAHFNATKLKYFCANYAHIYKSGHIFQWLPLPYYSKCSTESRKFFTDVCGFDVEEFAIDLYYWFDKSTNRKNELQVYCTFCDKDIV